MQPILAQIFDTMRPKRTLLFFILLTRILLLQAQSPVIVPLALQAVEKVDSLPKKVDIRWIAKANQEYYLHQAAGNVMSRDSAGNASWDVPSVPASFFALNRSMVNLANGVCLLAKTENNSGPGINRTFTILRTTSTWEEAEIKLSLTFHEIMGQPQQIADYQTSFFKLNDFVVYYQLHLFGLNGAPGGTRIFRSMDTGLSWQQVSAVVHVRAGDFFSIEDDHFLRADNHDMTNAVEWPFPDTSIKAADYRGLFLESDTFYFYTRQGVRWKKTENTAWQSEQLPFCRVYALKESWGHCYTVTSTGLFQVDHTETNWQPLLHIPLGISYDWVGNNRLAVVDSTDLFFFSDANGLLHSTDGGLTWQDFHRGLPGKGAYYLYAFGDSVLCRGDGSALAISGTGHSWQPFLTDTFGCMAPQSWLAAGQGGFMISVLRNTNASQSTCQIFYTPDRQHWISTPALFDYYNTPYTAYQENRLWLLGINNGPLYSDDLGQHWDTLDLQNLPSGIYIDPFYGWATKGDTIVSVDNNGKILRTTDFGQEWIHLSTPVSPANVSGNWIFRQKNQLLLCSRGGKIWTSTDWGDSWVQTCSGLPGYTQDASMYYQMLHDSILTTASFFTLNAGQRWVQLTGDVVPDNSPIDWNDDWMYFSDYVHSIYRTPVAAILDELNQSDTTATPVQHPETSKPWRIQPNPAREMLYITGSIPELSRWSIIDMYGQVVMHGIWLGGPIPITTLPAGIYILRLQHHGKTSVEKFIKTIR